jgi:gas vesicle protein
MMNRVNASEKPVNWRKRFKKATREEEDDKKDKLIDVELPKPKDGSSPSSGAPKDGSNDKFEKQKDLEEEKQPEPSYLQKGTETLK